MSSQAQRIGDSLRSAVAQAIRMLALELDAELRRATPVDTGHARRNWVPSIGQPNTTEAKDGSARAAGIQAVLAYELANGALWVANVVPYIRSLNYGSSQQQPAGFVERAIAVAIQKVEAKLAGKVDISGIRDAFARRHEFADQGADAPAGDNTSGGGEY